MLVFLTFGVGRFFQQTIIQRLKLRQIQNEVEVKFKRGLNDKNQNEVKMKRQFIGRLLWKKNSAEIKMKREKRKWNKKSEEGSKWSERHWNICAVLWDGSGTRPGTWQPGGESKGYFGVSSPLLLSYANNIGKGIGIGICQLILWFVKKMFIYACSSTLYTISHWVEFWNSFEPWGVDKLLQYFPFFKLIPEERFLFFCIWNCPCS